MSDEKPTTERPAECDATAPAPAPGGGDRCPVCWTAAGCRTYGTRAECRHREYGGTTGPVEREGVVYHVYSTPPVAVRLFFTTLFEPSDLILLRPIETWTETDAASGHEKKVSRVVHPAVTYRHADTITRLGSFWQRDLETAREQRANQFFGVCPRFRPSSYSQKWDNAFQIRIVRALWADLDYCDVTGALARCAAARLPEPTAVVSSGHGAHLYWRLAEAYRIDDVGKPPPVEWEDVTDGGVPVCHDDGRPKRRSFYTDLETGVKVYAPFSLSGKAQHVRSVLAGIADRLGGDHTIDLARLLRLPGTVNRKNCRNRQQSSPCALVECDPARRYPLSAFEPSEVPAEAGRKRPQSKAGRSGTAAVPPSRVAPPMGGASAGPAPAADPADDALIAKMRRKVGRRFDALFDDGDSAAHGGDHSRADYSLCRLIVSWTQDSTQIDRIFRRSALVRDKWLSRPDYREATIRRALAALAEARRGEEKLPTGHWTEYLDPDL